MLFQAAGTACDERADRITAEMAGCLRRSQRRDTQPTHRGLGLVCCFKTLFRGQPGLADVAWCGLFVTHRRHRESRRPTTPCACAGVTKRQPPGLWMEHLQTDRPRLTTSVTVSRPELERGRALQDGVSRTGAGMRLAVPGIATTRTSLAKHALQTREWSGDLHDPRTWTTGMPALFATML